ncbi:MAG: hypothetical protein ACP59X_09965 [Solidesulfovibrio sp. DCME]|uniref:hypothetical protein n=1 Tax=Solidesulfovibrio sp. DCME TaxID=3447380 RepID=UPI003D112CAB
MRNKVVVSLFCSAMVLAAAAMALAADPTPAPQAQPPAQQQPATPAKPHPSNPKTDAAEARYRAWSEREHAKDAAEFAKDKSKIEDKYKGYVRPKREKKPAAKDQSPPAPGN